VSAHCAGASLRVFSGNSISQGGTNETVMNCDSRDTKHSCSIRALLQTALASALHASHYSGRITAVSCCLPFGDAGNDSEAVVGLPWSVARKQNGIDVLRAKERPDAQRCQPKRRRFTPGQPAAS
jgi:hypothetical protein